MKRKGLIIGSPDKDIPGVIDDMRNYRAFFESAAGGGWFASEITTLTSPSKSEVQRELKNLTNADYSIVVFAGHGCYSKVERTTLLQLQPGVHIDEYLLKEGSPRHTLIIDACRVHVDVPLVEEIRKAVLAAERFADTSSSRAIFDDHLRKCRPDLAVMYACSVGEGAGDCAGQGGAYSATLLKQSTDWASSYANKAARVLSISEAHEQTTPLVQRQRGGRQTPTATFPRTVPRFPFAICA